MFVHDKWQISDYTEYKIMHRLLHSTLHCVCYKIGVATDNRNRSTVVMITSW